MSQRYAITLRRTYSVSVVSAVCVRPCTRAPSAATSVAAVRWGESTAVSKWHRNMSARVRCRYASCAHGSRAMARSRHGSCAKSGAGAVVGSAPCLDWTTRQTLRDGWLRSQCAVGHTRSKQKRTSCPRQPQRDSARWCPWQRTSRRWTAAPTRGPGGRTAESRHHRADHPARGRSPPCKRAASQRAHPAPTQVRSTGGGNEPSTSVASTCRPFESTVPCSIAGR